MTMKFLHYADKRIPTGNPTSPGFTREFVLECTKCNHQTFYILQPKAIRCANCGDVQY